MIFGHASRHSAKLFLLPKHLFWKCNIKVGSSLQFVIAVRFNKIIVRIKKHLHKVVFKTTQYE